MCGIVGYIGSQPCVDLIYKGLRKLEYRGYDSTGIAVLDQGKVATVKSEGKLSQLEPLLEKLPKATRSGIGHTRWATHGLPTTVNAHPHVHEGVALVHNGIIENYVELKRELAAEGATFHSQTDSEVVLQYFVRERRRTRDTLAALVAIATKVKGAFSLGILIADEPDSLWLVKLGSPLVIGAGDGENLFASDAMALLAHTNRAMFLADGEIARIRRDSVELWDFHGNPLALRWTMLEMSSASTEKMGFRHFMLKEIHEQPRVIASMIQRLVDLEQKKLRDDALGLLGIDLEKVTNIVMTACGTAYYSCLIGKYTLESIAGLPVNVELASELRYRDPWLDPSTLFIAVSQSGETADTLACVKHAKDRGCQVLAICNVKMSSIARAADATLFMEAGPEIGVASTKAFTGMVLAHHLLTLAIASRRGRLDEAVLERAIESLRTLPFLLDHAIDSKTSIEQIAEKYYESSNFIFMGRGYSFPIALEGALKLKEISYIHAEGYAGGELKHGPIALIDHHMPVLALAPFDAWHEKMLSNIEEVRARKGLIIGVGNAHDERLKALSRDFIGCPSVEDPALAAILSTVPLQLLAYYIAVKRGTDVDQPRNLAKSVTVE